MQVISESIEEVVRGGRYARTEEELYQKAIALLDKCKIEHPGPEQDTRESAFRDS